MAMAPAPAPWCPVRIAPPAENVFEMSSATERGGTDETSGGEGEGERGEGERGEAERGGTEARGNEAGRGRRSWIVKAGMYGSILNDLPTPPFAKT
jgi:hypothetical protein